MDIQDQAIAALAEIAAVERRTLGGLGTTPLHVSCFAAWSVTGHSAMLHASPRAAYHAAHPALPRPRERNIPVNFPFGRVLPLLSLRRSLGRRLYCDRSQPRLVKQTWLASAHSLRALRTWLKRFALGENHLEIFTRNDHRVVTGGIAASDQINDVAGETLPIRLGERLEGLK
jgi:hypothetical protein